MTFAMCPPPVTLVTGLNATALLDFFEDLDTDSAGMLARYLHGRLVVLQEEQRGVCGLDLVGAYIRYLLRACLVVMAQCPATELDRGHMDTIVEISDGLVWRIRLRMWYLRADQLLAGNTTRRDLVAPDVV
ncbi:unnamed protein product [Symbiodinium sp. CCMP2592]|nr:unnamed protein product [Symbiodinium sp. CCMP2592]